MPTETTEIADGVHRISTYVEPPGLVFNQFLLIADEPLLFHTGMRGLFPEVSAAVQRIVPLSRLRWITFGHLEADECGSMNEWLQAAPSSQIAHGVLGCRLSAVDQRHGQPAAAAAR
ncbi:oxygen-binding di-iron domain-containing protein [Saccharopolyspora tripterygii]